MGNRISKVYTRTGDDGTTGMADGSRVDKDSPLMEAIGTVDELNSSIGLLLGDRTLPADIDQVLIRIQHHLFDIGGELSAPEYSAFQADSVGWLEEVIDLWNGQLAPLKEFILPAGGRDIAQCHVCRSICRRAERLVITHSRSHTMRPELIAYLNRLSDLLFVLARYVTKQAGLSEVYWQKTVPRPE